jgi:hypothetical protein
MLSIAQTTARAPKMVATSAARCMAPCRPGQASEEDRIGEDQARPGVIASNPVDNPPAKQNAQDGGRGGGNREARDDEVHVSLQGPGQPVRD